MLALIKAIKAELQAREELEYIQDKNIAIVPSRYHLPGDAPKFPCIGIKDGTVGRRDLPCNVVEKTLQVFVIIYTRLQKDQERSVIGDESTGKRGILQVAEDVCSVLRNNVLDQAPDLQSAKISAESTSEFFTKADGSGTQRKEIVITYIREVEGCCS